MKEHLMNLLYLQDESVQLKDLYFVQNLGNENYGNVMIKKLNFIFQLKQYPESK